MASKSKVAASFSCGDPAVSSFASSETLGKRNDRHKNNIAPVHLPMKTSDAVKIPYKVVPLLPQQSSGKKRPPVSNGLPPAALISDNSNTEMEMMDRANQSFNNEAPSPSVDSYQPVQRQLDPYYDKYKKMLHEFETIRVDRDSFSEQLKLQTQVNDELKRLLIATMGDDLEIKLESLTNDKVRLAKDIVKYTAELYDEKEQLERMSIQADVWRSKFLASSLYLFSVMVDELVSWRHFVIRQYKDAQNCIKNLLTEQSDIRAALYQAFLLLNEAKDALNINEAGKYRHITQYHTIKDLTDCVNSLGQELNKKLLNTVSVKQQTSLLHISKEPLIGFTDCQKSATKIASIDSDQFYSPSPCEEFQKLTGQQLKFLGHPSHCNYRNLTVNCCKKCAGEIKVV